MELSFTAQIRLRTAKKDKGSWHFVSVSKEVTKEIKAAQAHVEKKRGRGSVRVEARIGFVKRKTSVFPDKKGGTYVLPLKADVRKQLQVGEGDEVLVYLDLL